MGSLLPLPWSEKYRPTTLSEVLGHGKVLGELSEWARAWDSGTLPPPEKRGVVLVGDPGVGKTCALYALAHDHGWEVVELNASDVRNDESVRSIAGTGSTHRSLFSPTSRTLILIDEAENLFGSEDAGGAGAILEVLRKTLQPLALVANDLYELERRVGTLRGRALILKFARVHRLTVQSILKRVAAREGIEVEPSALEALSERAQGDVRAALNDLQAISEGTRTVRREDVEALGGRDRAVDLWGLLGKIFYGKGFDDPRLALRDVDETPENVALWIDENLPRLYEDPVDRVEAYALLSRADVLLGRTIRRQHYALWSYASELMTGGVSVVRHREPSKVRFQYPEWFRHLSESRSRRVALESAAHKIAPLLHMTSRRVRLDLLPYLSLLLRSTPDMGRALVQKARLDPKEVGALLDASPTDPLVQSLTKVHSEPKGSLKEEPPTETPPPPDPTRPTTLLDF